jgi:hypothetical protein
MAASSNTDVLLILSSGHRLPIEHEVTLPVGTFGNSFALRIVPMATFTRSVVGDESQRLYLLHVIK